MSRAPAFFRAAFPDADERALATALLRNPKDGAARLVYADWLDERGDGARAEFLRLQHTLKAGKGTARLRARRRALRRRLDPFWLSVVGDTLERFREVQEEVERSNDPAYFAPGDPDRSYLAVSTDWGLLDVEVQGDCDAVQPFLASPEVAPVLRSLSIRSNGVSNGTRFNEIDALVAGDHDFSGLMRFEVEQEGEDGIPIIGNYNEAGVLGRLLRKCPALETLIVPSAPDASFFRVGRRPLVTLNVHAGYDTQNFIWNLSQSACFPRLRVLDWEDYCQSYMPDWRSLATAFEHYQALFRSPALASVEKVVLRNVSLTPAQVRRLLAIRKDGVEIHRHR